MRSSRRLATLDAMRGMAALVVALHHVVPMAAGWALFPRGYLAVDFFFMLSGFVIARTYEPRFDAGMQLTPFMAARLRRLYPTIFLGILLGAAVQLAGGIPFRIVAWMFVTESLFLPQLGGGMLGVFRLDGVQWSLFYELFANAVHALSLHRVASRVLTLIALLALGALTIIAGQWGSLAIGDRGLSFLGGVPRVLFSYVIGIVLARRASIDVKAVLAAVPITLLVFAITAAGLVSNSQGGWIVDLVVVSTIFPVLIVLGASATIKLKYESQAAYVGALSYPLYAVHLPAATWAIVLVGSTRGMFTLGVALLAAFSASHIVFRLAQTLAPSLKLSRTTTMGSAVTLETLRITRRLAAKLSGN